MSIEQKASYKGQPKMSNIKNILQQNYDTIWYSQQERTYHSENSRVSKFEWPMGSQHRIQHTEVIKLSVEYIHY